MDLDKLLLFLKEQEYPEYEAFGSYISETEELRERNRILEEKLERKSARIDELMERNFKLFSEIGKQVDEKEHAEEELRATEDELGEEDKKEEEEKRDFEDLFDEKGEIK